MSKSTCLKKSWYEIREIKSKPTKTEEETKEEKENCRITAWIADRCYYERSMQLKK